jgi:molecular chaperone HscB
VQPANAGLDHFARLGLAPSYALDPAALERSYLDLQRRLHPDRFATRPERERRYSAEQSVAVNEAYAVLKAPLGRARYMLALEGRQVGGEDGITIDDPEVLMEAMETREALAEAADAHAVGALAGRAAATAEACRAALEAAFAAGDLDGAARLTLRLGYLDKLADEIRRRRIALVGAAA